MPTRRDFLSAAAAVPFVGLGSGVSVPCNEADDRPVKVVKGVPFLRFTEKFRVRYSGLAGWEFHVEAESLSDAKEIAASVLTDGFMLVSTNGKPESKFWLVADKADVITECRSISDSPLTSIWCVTYIRREDGVVDVSNVMASLKAGDIDVKASRSVDA